MDLLAMRLLPENDPVDSYPTKSVGQRFCFMTRIEDLSIVDTSELNASMERLRSSQILVSSDYLNAHILINFNTATLSQRHY
jgi:hypothetical protein